MQLLQPIPESINRDLALRGMRVACWLVLSEILTQPHPEEVNSTKIRAIASGILESTKLDKVDTLIKCEGKLNSEDKESFKYGFSKTLELIINRLTT